MPSRTRRFRGSRTHGRGNKAGRGKGKRGGTGNAGLHKHRFKEMLKYFPDHFGRRGFKRPPEIVELESTINIEEVEESLGKYLLSGAAKQSEGKIQIDLGNLGYDKLLGGGRASLPLTIIVPKASTGAVEKVKKAGGVVVAEEVTSDEKKRAGRAARAAPPPVKAAPAPPKGAPKSAPKAGPAPEKGPAPGKGQAPPRPATEKGKAPPKPPGAPEKK